MEGADILCTPCSDGGSDIKAICKCVECQSWFCQTCLQLHNKILKSHTLIGKTDMEHGNLNSRLPSPTNTCDEHPPEVLKLFCRNHDVVCCTVCAAIYHRICDGMQHIPKIAKGINDSQDKAESVESLNKVREDLQQLLSEQRENLSRLNNQRDEIVNTMKEMTNILMTRIKKLEGQTLQDVDAGHKHIESDIKCDINYIEKELSSVEKHLDQIKELGTENEVKLFIFSKLGQKLAKNCTEQLYRLKDKKVKHLLYKFSSNIESCLKEIESYGNLEGGNHAAVASLIGEYSVTLETEQTDSVSVYGVCLLETNEIIIADNCNLKLKRLDARYQMVDWIDLGATPYSLCRTGYSEVAVSFPWLHKIQFVSVGRKMVSKWSFKVDEICRGICCSEGNLYICCGGSGSEDPGHVVVYDMTGSLLRAFNKDESGKSIFMCPENVHLSGSKIYVVDKKAGVVVLDKDGRSLSLISDPRLVCTNDASVGGHGELYVCGKDSLNVLQFDKRGNVIDEILSEEDNKSTPLTVFYLPNPARLLITYERSGKILLFKLDDNVYS